MGCWDECVGSVFRDGCDRVFAGAFGGVYEEKERKGLVALMQATGYILSMSKRR